MTAPSILPLTAAPSHIPPCRQQPEAFDADPVRGPATAIHWLAVNRAMSLCRTHCPVLEECRSYATDHPEIRGVIAGQHRPWTGYDFQRPPRDLSPAERDDVARLIRRQVDAKPSELVALANHVRAGA